MLEKPISTEAMRTRSEARCFLPFACFIFCSCVWTCTGMYWLLLQLHAVYSSAHPWDPSCMRPSRSWRTWLSFLRLKIWWWTLSWRQCIFCEGVAIVNSGIECLHTFVICLTCDLHPNSPSFPTVDETIPPCKSEKRMQIAMQGYLGDLCLLSYVEVRSNFNVRRSLLISWVAAFFMQLRSFTSAAMHDCI